MPSPFESAGQRRFETTQWSIVLGAGNAAGSNARKALADLCEAYWYPLYAFVRRRGYAAEDAQDRTQSFLAHLLEKDVIAHAQPERGRFRSFLLASLSNFLANEHDRAAAQKRGGGQRMLTLDFDAGESRLSLEPAHELTAERLFDRHWALTLLDTVVGSLQEEFAQTGKSAQFELLKGALASDRDRLPYEELAQQLGVSAAAARQAASRLRKRYRELLRETVAQTLADPADVDEEISSLFNALRAP